VGRSLPFLEWLNTVAAQQQTAAQAAAAATSGEGLAKRPRLSDSGKAASSSVAGRGQGETALAAATAVLDEAMIRVACWPPWDVAIAAVECCTPHRCTCTATSEVLFLQAQGHHGCLCCGLLLLSLGKHWGGSQAPAAVLSLSLLLLLLPEATMMKPIHLTCRSLCDGRDLAGSFQLAHCCKEWQPLLCLVCLPKFPVSDQSSSSQTCRDLNTFPCSYVF
jgi:hypothetical protein